MKTNARLNSSRKIRERDPRPSLILSLLNEKKRSLCVVLCVLSVVVYVGDHHTEGYDQSERRDPERESKREREFCVQFSLIGKRIHWQFRRSVVVQDWKKRGKLRENLNLNTHHIIKRIVTSSSL